MLDKIKIGINSLFVGIAMVVLAVAVLAVNTEEIQQVKVLLGGQEIIVTVADTPALRAQGLSFRDSIKQNEGMLFVFETPEMSGFWMKDMSFSIDVIWFDKEKRIIDVWENADPQSYPRIVTPRVPAQFVLEVPAGFFKENKLKIGNMFEILK